MPEQMTDTQVFFTALCFLGCVTLVLLALITYRAEVSVEHAKAQLPPLLDVDARHRDDIVRDHFAAINETYPETARDLKGDQPWN